MRRTTRVVITSMAPTNPRGLTTAVGAVTVIALFFVYSRLATQVAKRDAAKYRANDGGQLNWRNESLRRHGVMERPESPSIVGALFSSTKLVSEATSTERSSTAEDDALQAAKRKKMQAGDERAR
ncbi:MAG: hypothetical protein Q9210_004857 [Variospora velana]